MKRMDCNKHGMVFCTIGANFLKSELCCQASSDKVVVTGASKAVMTATEAPSWCPLKAKASAK
jgi:hypothetical protein